MSAVLCDTSLLVLALSLLGTFIIVKQIKSIVARTNKSNENVIKIGSPADSINSMVVNAVTKSGLSTKYARKGLALSFFDKLDISYYGGSKEQYIKVYESSGASNIVGTSFAAP